MEGILIFPMPSKTKLGDLVMETSHQGSKVWFPEAEDKPTEHLPTQKVVIQELTTPA